MLDRLIEDLKADEGWRATAYEDSLGYLTIGYGFLIDDRKGGELPHGIAEQWLAYNVCRNRANLNKAIPWLLDQPEDVQVALNNMAYQLGVAGLLRFKNMLAALEQGNRTKAAVEALDSTWAKQTPQRAVRIAKLIQG